MLFRSRTTTNSRIVSKVSDSEVEAAIQTQLERLMAGKTVIAIAHRLSTIAAMDRLIVLDEGRVVGRGTHAELLADNQTYREIVDSQLTAEDVA